MTDTLGSYLWDDGKAKTIDEVRRYWTENVNTTQFWTGDPRLIGTAEFFDTLERFIRRNYAHRYRLIKSEAAKYPNGELLEIGCGAGWESVAWAQAGMRVHAIDLSEAALVLARRNLEHHQLQADLRWGNAEDIPFPDNSFDIVASFGVLHQTESTERAVAEVRRVLKTGGEAVITLYYKYSWKICLTKLGRVNFEFSHEDAPITRLYDKKELYQLFKDFAQVEVFLDYTRATPSPRKGFLAVMYNRIFVPTYNLLPSFIRNRFGHAAIVIAKK